MAIMQIRRAFALYVVVFVLAVPCLFAQTVTMVRPQRD